MNIYPKLGEYSINLHQKIGTIVKENNINILITVGNESKNIAKQAKSLGMNDIYCYETINEAVQLLNKILTKEDVVLIKASNSMHFNKIVEEIIK